MKVSKPQEPVMVPVIEPGGLAVAGLPVGASESDCAGSAVGLVSSASVGVGSARRAGA